MGKRCLRVNGNFSRLNYLAHKQKVISSYLLEFEEASKLNVPSDMYRVGKTFLSKNLRCFIESCAIVKRFSNPTETNNRFSSFSCRELHSHGSIHF